LPLQVYKFAEPLQDAALVQEPLTLLPQDPFVQLPFADPPQDVFEPSPAIIATVLSICSSNSSDNTTRPNESNDRSLISRYVLDICNPHFFGIKTK